MTSSPQMSKAELIEAAHEIIGGDANGRRAKRAQRLPIGAG